MLNYNQRRWFIFACMGLQRVKEIVLLGGFSPDDGKFPLGLGLRKGPHEVPQNAGFLYCGRRTWGGPILSSSPTGNLQPDDSHFTRLQVGETAFNVVPPYEVASWGFTVCGDNDGCGSEDLRM